MAREPHSHAIVGADEFRLLRLEILARTTQQPCAGECHQPVVIQPRELATQVGQEMIRTSHSANRFGVSAAISMPAAARRAAIALSYAGSADMSSAARPSSRTRALASRRHTLTR